MKTSPRQLTKAVAAAIVCAVTGCTDKAKEGSAQTPPEVEVVTVEQVDVPIYREWVGTLEGEVNATLSAQVSGYLVSREYREGRLVTNGQVLFQIDQAPFAATLAKAKGQQADSSRAKLSPCDHQVPALELDL